MTETDRAILLAADLPWAERVELAAKAGMSSARWHQRFVQLLQEPAAEQELPQLVHRWRRIMAARRRRRNLDVA